MGLFQYKDSHYKEAPLFYFYNGNFSARTYNFYIESCPIEYYENTVWYTNGSIWNIVYPFLSISYMLCFYGIVQYI